MITSDSQPRSVTVGDRPVSVWFAPVQKQVDLAQAQKLIQGAKEGVLFLIFDPGPKGTLLNDILGLDPDKLYIHGVVNEDPGGKKNPVIKLVHRGHLVEAPAEVALPAAIDDRLKYWLPEMKQFSIVIVHSKLIVVDPFGDHPVVMTGSHNMGPKASSSNDDNLVIVEHDPVVAFQYAVNVMTVYNQYRWRDFGRRAKTLISGMGWSRPTRGRTVTSKEKSFASSTSGSVKRCQQRRLRRANQSHPPRPRSKRRPKLRRNRKPKPRRKPRPKPR